MFVILFGAWVRITGSGAGCGQHWPTCHGEVAHRPESIETMIELTHRLTSGLDGILALALVVFAFRAFDRGHLSRRASVLALVFIVIEALIGAVLVKNELVANDDSVARAVVMAIHLVNTSLLTGAMAVAAWASLRDSKLSWKIDGRVRWLLVGGIVGMLVTSMSGAVTALGDTLYPVDESGNVIERLVSDQGLTAHFLQRMRIVHPIMASALGLYALYMANTVRDRRETAQTERWARWTSILVVAQVGAGVVNIMISAPGWMQIVHLGLAKALWVAMVLLAAAAFERD